MCNCMVTHYASPIGYIFEIKTTGRRLAPGFGVLEGYREP